MPILVKCGEAIERIGFMRAVPRPHVERAALVERRRGALTLDHPDRRTELPLERIGALPEVDAEAGEVDSRALGRLHLVVRLDGGPQAPEGVAREKCIPLVR